MYFFQAKRPTPWWPRADFGQKGCINLCTFFTMNFCTLYEFLHPFGAKIHEFLHPFLWIFAPFMNFCTPRVQKFMKGAKIYGVQKFIKKCRGAKIHEFLHPSWIFAPPQKTAFFNKYGFLIFAFDPTSVISLPINNYIMI